MVKYAIVLVLLLFISSPKEFSGDSADDAFHIIETKCDNLVTLPLTSTTCPSLKRSPV